MSTNTQLIIFDLDDTLIPSSAIYSESLKECGIDPKGIAFQQAREQVKAELPPRHPTARNRLLYFKKMLENQKEFSAEKLLQLQDQYEQKLVEKIEKFMAQTQRLSFLKKLAQKYTLVILTNENTRTQMLKMKAIDPLSQAFKKVLTSEELGVEKPDSKGYLLLLKEFAKNPAQSLIVGDSLSDDIEAGQKLGIPAIWTYEFLEGKNTKTHTHSIAKLEDLEWMIETV